jgi:hypothetical protein
MNGYEK